MKKLTALFLFICMMMISSAALAQQAAQSAGTAAANTVKRWILINIPARSLRLYDNDKVIAMYPVGVGKPETKTPAGYYKIVEKIVNPTWVDPEDTSVSIGSGPDNPLGYRWMGIGGNYGIHGTNKPASVGHYVSNGCIRMVEANVEEVFDKVQVGTEVQIIYNRLVIDKTPDNRIAYYIYPDGYNMQNLTADFVRQGLNGYGVGDFVTNEQLQQAINASNGQANYVAAPVNVFKDGTKLGFKAVNYQNLIYIPVRELSNLYNAPLKAEGSAVSTAKGSAPFYNFNGRGYIRLTDISNLFDSNYTLNKNVTEVTLTKPVEAQTLPSKEAGDAGKTLVNNTKVPAKDADVKQDKAADNSAAQQLKAKTVKVDKAAAAKTAGK